MSVSFHNSTSITVFTTDAVILAISSFLHVMFASAIGHGIKIGIMSNSVVNAGIVNRILISTGKSGVIQIVVGHFS